MKFWSPLFRAWWSPGGTFVPTAPGAGWVRPERFSSAYVIPETVVPPLVKN